MEDVPRRTSLTPALRPLVSILFDRGGNSRAFRLSGEGGDHFHCSEEEIPPEKILPKEKGHLNNCLWATYPCHREEGKSLHELFEKVCVNVVFFGNSGFGVGVLPTFGL